MLLSKAIQLRVWHSHKAVCCCGQNKRADVQQWKLIFCVSLLCVCLDHGREPAAWIHFSAAERLGQVSSNLSRNCLFSPRGKVNQEPPVPPPSGWSQGEVAPRLWDSLASKWCLAPSQVAKRCFVRKTCNFVVVVLGPCLVHCLIFIFYFVLVLLMISSPFQCPPPLFFYSFIEINFMLFCQLHESWKFWRQG